MRPIAAADARRIVTALHYSGSVVQNSKLHLGVFLDGRCCGAMQFGPSMFHHRMLGLVSGSGPENMLELNSMAFSDALPRNSESRALAVACRLLRVHAPAVRWILTFADGCSCGDGTIYRAAGFLLLRVKRNTAMLVDPTTGEQMTRLSARHAGVLESSLPAKPGFMLQYVRFLDSSWRDRLTVPVLPFSAIDEAGARMARGV